MPDKILEFEEIIRLMNKKLNVLIDEAQRLADQESLLKQKLQSAHEQYERLADKYASSDPEITKALELLKPMPLTSSIDMVDPIHSSQQDQGPSSEITAVIDNVRLVAQRLEKFATTLSGSTLSNRSLAAINDGILDQIQQKTESTVLEQETEVPEKLSYTGCPFPHQKQKSRSTNCTKLSQLRIKIEPLDSPVLQNSIHDPSNPINEANTEKKENLDSKMANSKCPIRLLGQHSPEEVARYFETHKHEIPRSHEICVKRQQRNEDRIRKLDAKYGDLVSMIEELGEKHQPLLPCKDENQEKQHLFNERLERWVKNVSATETNHEIEQHSLNYGEDRGSILEKPLKDIQVGESPSRPWGISVPITNSHESRRNAPQQLIPITTIGSTRSINRSSPRKHNLIKLSRKSSSTESRLFLQQSASSNTAPHNDEEPPLHKCSSHRDAKEDTRPPTYPTHQVNKSQSRFIKNLETVAVSSAPKSRMIFTGPVFIEYPTEEAIKIMQYLK